MQPTQQRPDGQTTQESSAFAGVGVIGLNWRQCSADQLAQFTIARERLDERMGQLAGELGVDELLYLATCNRVEVFFRMPHGAPMVDLRSRIFEALSGSAPAAGEAMRSLRAWADEGAAEHIFMVAAGLDSAEIGETEIHGQLKRALDLGLDTGALISPSSKLATIISEALKLSRRLRQDQDFSTGRQSLAELAMDKLRGHLSPTQNTTGGPRVLFIGASPMNERCATSLAAAGIPFMIANRSRANAEAFAKAANGLHSGICTTAVTLDELADQLPAVEAVLSATAASTPILDAAALSTLAHSNPSEQPLLVIDFAVPPDIDPAAVEALNARGESIRRIGMQSLIDAAAATRHRRLDAAAGARTEIDDSLGRLAQRLGNEHVAPFVSTLQQSYRSTAKANAQELLDGPLADLNSSQKTAVLNFAAKLAGRFAHLPSTGLFEVARVAGPTAVDAFLARADRELKLDFERASKQHKREDS